MALTGSSKERSVRQEERIAYKYGGERSLSSGAQVHDSGDVLAGVDLIECKTTGVPGKPAKLPGFMKEFEKIALEATERMKFPVLCLQYYCPESDIANRDGMVEVSVRFTNNDANNAHNAQCR
jgi:hypothetical protein